MKILKKLATMASLVVLACGGLTVTAEEKNNYGLDIEKIVIATSPGYEPFEFLKDGELAGYDVDVWKEFEKRTGIKVEWEHADFSGLLGLLDTDRADVVAAQMSPTPEREEKYDFSQPVTYFTSNVFVKDDSGFEKVEDLDGKKIGVGSGNEMQREIQEKYPDCKFEFEIYTSATLDNMMSDVEFGRIDGMLAQNVQGSMAVEKSGASLKMLPPFAQATGTYIVKKGRPELLEAIDKFIEEIKADGTLKEISEKWTGIDISEEPTE